MKKMQKGFTLIELMVAVAVMGILAAIAYPQYQGYVMGGKIVQATGGLSDGRIRMEQFAQDNKGAYNAPGYLLPPDTEYFTFSLGNDLSASTYTIIATGQGSMGAFAYSINQSNTKKTLATFWGDTSEVCWIRKQGGAC